jgi:hypothetical protein
MDAGNSGSGSRCRYWMMRMRIANNPRFLVSARAYFAWQWFCSTAPAPGVDITPTPNANRKSDLAGYHFYCPICELADVRQEICPAVRLIKKAIPQNLLSDPALLCQRPVDPPGFADADPAGGRHAGRLQLRPAFLHFSTKCSIANRIRGENTWCRLECHGSDRSRHLFGKKVATG